MSGDNEKPWIQIPDSIFQDAKSFERSEPPYAGGSENLVSAGRFKRINFNSFQFPEIFERRYKMPKGFPDFSKLLGWKHTKLLYIAGEHLERARAAGYDRADDRGCFEVYERDDVWDSKLLEDWQADIARALFYCLHCNPPVFCLDLHLLNKFQKTNPTFLQESPFPSFALCMKGPGLGNDSIVFASCHGEYMVCGWVIITGSEPPQSNTWKIGFGEKPCQEDLMNNMICHTIAYMNTYKDSVEAMESVIQSSKGIGFSSKAKSKPTEFVRPRMISSTQRVVVRHKPRSTTTDRDSPSAHWRRGHWHKYWTGKGRKEEKFNWIEPILVGAGDDE